MSNSYRWELGLDWTAVVGPENESYMPAGFIQVSPPPILIKRPRVMSGDTIDFIIFDLTPGGAPDVKIASFTINPRAAINDQPNVAPLDFLQLRFKRADPQDSTFFEGRFPCWTIDHPTGSTDFTTRVTQEAATMKFLMSFYVQAEETLGRLRTFVHDPEMVVGPFP